MEVKHYREAPANRDGLLERSAAYLLGVVNGFALAGGACGLPLDLTAETPEPHWDPGYKVRLVVRHRQDKAEPPILL